MEFKPDATQLSPSNLPILEQMENTWGMPTALAAVAQNAQGLYKIKHGMFASVPILCKADQCPYKETCRIDPSFRISGQRCPQEAGAIMARYEQWCRHFKINFEGDAVSDGDLVDVSLIRDLVENEIQILRAENKIAISGDFIGRTISSIDQRGNVYYEDAVTPEAQYKLQLQDKRYKLLNLLNSTRKDKASDMKQLTPSEEALSIFRKINEQIGQASNAMPSLDSIDFSSEMPDDAE